MTTVENNGASVDEEMKRLALGGEDVVRNRPAFINNTNGRGQSHVTHHSEATHGGISRHFNREMNHKPAHMRNR